MGDRPVPHFQATAPSVYATRREFLSRVGGGFGTLALAGLLEAQEDRARSPLAPRPAHGRARAK